MIEHKFTPKTLGFDVLKETFTPVHLIGIEVDGKKIDARKSLGIYENIRNSPRIAGTCFIFLDTLRGIMNEMSEEEKLKRAKEIAYEMTNMKGLSDYDITEGNKMSSPALRKIVELEKELRKLGY